MNMFDLINWLIVRQKQISDVKVTFLTIIKLFNFDACKENFEKSLLNIVLCHVFVLLLF